MAAKAGKKDAQEYLHFARDLMSFFEKGLRTVVVPAIELNSNQKLLPPKKE